MKMPRLCSVLFLFLLATGLFPLCSNAQTPDASDPSARQRFWLQGEYLHWWMKGNELPPLVTSSPPGTNGTLPGSTVLFGGTSVDGDGRNGARVSLDYWLDSEHKLGLDGGLILLGFNGGTEFAAASTGTPLLARPFFNVLTSANDSELVAAPGRASGNISTTTANNLQSVSFALQRNLRRADGHHVDAIFGYRYFHYQDTLTVQQSSTDTSGLFAGTVAGADRFAANNSFHGGEVGLEGGIERGHLSLNFGGRVALGAQNISGKIGGITTAGGSTFVGDLLALSSNIGSQSKTSFGVLPQINAAGHYSFSRFTASLGYTFLYLNDVLRTGGQIDLNVDPFLLPPVSTTGPASPQARMSSGGFWAQGLSTGLQFRF